MNRLTTNVLIELHVPNFRVTLTFYQLLGFRVLWMSQNYLVMQKGEGSIIQFYGDSDRIYEQAYFKRFPRDSTRGYGVEIVIMDDDIKALYEKLKDQVNVVEPLQLRHWGKWDFRIEDPFGFYLRVTEPICKDEKREEMRHTKAIMRQKDLLQNGEDTSV